MGKKVEGVEFIKFIKFIKFIRFSFQTCLARLVILNAFRCRGKVLFQNQKTFHQRGSVDESV